MNNKSEISRRPSIIHLFLSFLRLGLTAFGGLAMIAYIKELSVNKNRWIDEDSFKHGLALCQTLPWPIVVNTASYIGLTEGPSRRRLRKLYRTRLVYLCGWASIRRRRLPLPPSLSSSRRSLVSSARPMPRKENIGLDECINTALKQRCLLKQSPA